MFRTIVVGCDGSDRDTEALALARQLRHPDGHLLLATVEPKTGGAVRLAGDYGHEEFLREDAGGVLARAAATLPAGIPVETRVVFAASPGGALDRIALEAGADLIVLGSSHRRTLGRLTGRTTVQRMLEGAPCAVAVAVRGQADRFREHPWIGVACDDSDEAAVAVETAFAIAAETDAVVRLCRAVEPTVYPVGFTPNVNEMGVDTEREARAEAELKAVAARAPEGVFVETRVQAGPAAATLIGLARDADLLVTGSRHHGPMHRVLVGSVSTALATDGHLPVLVTPRASAAAPGTGRPLTAGAAGDR